MSSFTSSITNHWPHYVSYLFITAVVLALTNDVWLILLLPILLMVAALAVIKPWYLLLLIVALTPLSINLEEIGKGDLSLYLPTEPLLLGFTIVILLGQLHSRFIPMEVWKHPVTKALGFYLGWMSVSALFSTDIVVSVKYIITRIWFLVPLYLFGIAAFLNLENISKFYVAYLIPFMAIVVYTTLRHSTYGFDENSAHWIMEPFYRDHTQYGAIVAFFIPILFGYLTRYRESKLVRVAGALSLFLLIITLMYTYSRAALLSVVVAFAIWLLVKIRMHVRMIFSLLILILMLVFMNYDNILMQLQKNRTDSSDNLVENVESITNITTDASNLERINRWQAVFAMTRERPVVGFGPGTYMFEYAPYQMSKDMTIISTNFGDVGNAHSEYLGPLAETGVPGLLTVLFLVFSLFWSASKAYRRLEEGAVRHWLLFSALALITYFSHGVLNNFLDADKASIPVFGAMAVIVAIDIATRKSTAES